MQEVELALIQRLLPEELLLKTFALLGPYALGRVACVTKQWRTLSHHSGLWKPACLEAFAADGESKLEALLRLHYKCVPCVTSLDYTSSLIE